MKKSKAPADIGPVARYERAIAGLEQRLKEARERRDRLADNAAPDILKAVEGGSDPTQTTRTLGIADSEVAAVERALATAREQLKAEQKKANRAEELRRWQATEQLLTGPATEAMRKIQAGADLLIAGHNQLAETMDEVRQTIPKRPHFWPAIWAEQLEGRIRQYIGARSNLLRILHSERPAVLAGPDLMQLHAKAVRETLGDHHNPEEKAA